MIETVARALGNDLLADVAFVGGCTTGLLLTDDFTRESVRATDDVDLIVNVMGYGQWHQLKEQLKEKGFSESMEDDVICRLRLGELQVDIMPDDAFHRDLEDLLNLFDGRPSLVEELSTAPEGRQVFVADEISKLLELQDFEYAVQSTARGDQQREEIIFERLEAASQLKGAANQ